MIRVLHIIPSLRKGGAERLVLDICNELGKRDDVQVKLITFREENDYPFLSENIDHEVVPASYIPSFKGKDNISVKHLQEAIDTFQPTVIHSHLFESEIVLSAINYANAKYVVHFHDNMHQLRKPGLKRFLNKKNLTDAYERKLVLHAYRKRAVTFIAISRHTKEYIRKNLPSGINTVLLHNAIDIDRFSHQFGEHQKNRMIMIGSLVPKKNQSLALRVVAELKAKGHEFHLDLLGDGPLRKELENLSKEIGVNELVNFHGNVDDPENYLSKAGIYLHTARYEPFGLALLEAMAAGVPVVCTNGGGNMDIAEDGRNSIVMPFDAALIAERIAALIANNEEYEALKESGRKYVNSFDIHNYTTELLKLYTRN